MKQPYLECGKVITTHGVRGAVKIESWCDSPKVLASLSRVYLREQDGTFSEKTLKNPSANNNLVIAYIGDADSMDDAILLRGRVLYAAREDLPLPRGKVFLADLVDLPVIDERSGKVYGKLREVRPSPASDLYVIETPSGEVLLPAVDEFIARRDPESGIYITPIPGFFEESDT